MLKNRFMQVEKIPVFILCGGLGTRLKEETEFRPKPMVMVGERPLLWHIMNWYSHFGFKKFVLCMGYKSEVIRDYFLNFYAMNSDATIRLKDNSVNFHSSQPECDWEVSLAYTGAKTMTGARVAIAAKKFLGDSSHFAVTYGDGLTNANLKDEWAFHLEQKKIGTVLGVNPPSRFGEFRFEDDQLSSFVEKPDIKNAWINGGYFFFNREFLNYLSVDENCVLEQKPLSNLSGNRQLSVWKHEGFWKCLDTQRDYEEFNHLWASGSAPWLTSR
jgi:glucose-1-phosphate cytidylyltransferase